MKRFVIFVCVVCLSTLSVSADLVEYFQSNQLIDDHRLDLRGVGLKRVVFFKEAFVAGFYLAEDVDVDDAFEDVARRIEVKYFVSLPADKLTKYTLNLMRKNLTDMELFELEQEIKLMGDYFTDLSLGDRFALTYIPGEGTQFEHNHQIVGVIEGLAFANGIFSTWIGENPMDQKIKQELLGL